MRSLLYLTLVMYFTVVVGWSVATSLIVFAVLFFAYHKMSLFIESKTTQRDVNREF